MPTVDCGELLRYIPQLDIHSGSPIIHMATANQLKMWKLLLGDKGIC